MNKFDYYKDILKLLRLPQLCAVAIAQLVLHFYYFEPAMAYYGGEAKMEALPLTLCVLATVCTAASGFLANDYFDTRIDKVNRPLTRIVDASVSRDTAFYLCMGATAIALVVSAFLAYLASNSTYFFVFAGVVGLVWFYSASYKRIMLLGNVMFGLAFAMIPFTVLLFDIWFANMTYGAFSKADAIFTKILNQSLLISFFVFGYMFVYDIVRGMEEEKGERELECRSLCIVCGKKVAKAVIIVVTIIVGLALVSCCIASKKFTGQIGIYIAFFVISLTIALSVQIVKSKVRFDYLIIYGLIYILMAVALGLMSIYAYYLE
ncbi:MAG: UbiA family prenyltransferase [Paludibacteraceae bacterium]|nr:UbiA family prenyltransferase [Paludibacteraceae bacterium]